MYEYEFSIEIIVVHNGKHYIKKRRPFSDEEKRKLPYDELNNGTNHRKDLERTDH